jgi:hypothetical protein
MVMAKLAVITGRKEHAARINEAWQRGVDAVIETGMLIIDAREGLEHGEYIAMVENDLHFKRAMAFKLVAIASNKVLSNVSHGKHLPSAWTVLYDLTTVGNKGFDLEAGIASGAIHPGMERKDVKGLLPPPQRDDDLDEPDDDLPAPKPDEDELAVAWKYASREKRASFLHGLGREVLLEALAAKARWICDDGGQPAGVRGGCVVRAIAIATGKPHREVHQELIEATRRYASTHRNRVVEWIKRGRSGYDPIPACYEKIYSPYLENLGWRRVSTDNRKVRLRADELPPGRLIVEVHRHLVAVIDGVIHDTYDSGGAGRRPVKAFYISPVEADAS